MRRLGPLIAVAVVAVAFLVTVFFLWERARGPAVVIQTATPEVRDIVRKTVATGAVVPRNEVEIKARVSGVLSAIHVETGDVVDAGDLLAEIRVVPDAARLASAQARVRTAELALADARRELERGEKLARDGAIGAAELERLRSTHAMRRAELDAARVDLQIVREGASRGAAGASTEVRSTVPGMVLWLPVEVGQSVIESNTFNEGTTIASVADMTDLIFQGRVDESEVGRIQVGMPLDISVAAFPGQVFAGTLEHIAVKGELDQGAVQFEIRAALTRPEDVFLRAGSSANADIVLERADGVLAIPEALLQFDGDRPYVERADGQGGFARSDVELGISDGIWVEIKAGVEPGDTLKRPEG
ncbi:MAG: efflux RND transporter periplasmic adaptor subunit [Deltaproteobacteria bacterium]|nr:MAG: efflux RND transporter periplasmic adaptor subunit [Deltaproteobacteria bacterium]